MRIATLLLPSRVLFYSSLVPLRHPKCSSHFSPPSDIPNPSHRLILHLGRGPGQEPAMSSTAQKVATHAASARKTTGRRPPSVVREIVYGMSLGLFAGYLWKLHHWSNQRRTREFYSLLDQGRITVVVDEPPGTEE
ncbi:hypothetical protein ACP70R_030565 [Stipagrostis hirtigluma subsp. patula]